MNNSTPLLPLRLRNCMHYPARQSGIVLVIALIVLVAMTLAGIGLMRAVDTNTAVAGNLAFRQSAVQAADVALKRSLDWLRANSASNAMNSNNGAGYYAAEGAAIPTGPDGEELFEQFDWDNFAVHVGTDPTTGNRLDYVVERQCSTSGSVDASNAHCAFTEITSNSATCAGCSHLVGGVPPNVGVAQYRVTVRVLGPRNTVSYVQSNQY